MPIVRNKHFLCGGLLVFLGVTLNISVNLWSKVQRKLTASGQVSPHRGFGTHFVTITVGNPSQSFRLAVAPESDHTSLPCSGCSTCQAPLFKYNELSVNKCQNDCFYEASFCEAGSDAACKATVNYSDHIDISGYTGIEITDTADLYNSFSDAEQSHNSLVAFPLRFICQQENFGSAHVANGVLGMSNSEMSFVNQLYKADRIDRPIFSLCFRRFDDYLAEGSSAGHVTFGHVDRRVLNSPLIWADNQAYPESRGNYAVHIHRIYMGRGSERKQVLKAFSMGTLSSMSIDGIEGGADYSNMDGTLGVTPIQTNEVITYLHTGVEAAFKSTFKHFTQKDYTTPSFKLTQDEYRSLPTIFVQVESKQAEFGGTVIGDIVTGLVGNRNDPDRPFDVVIAIPPENYIVYEEGLAYPTIYFEQNPRIASNILQNYEIVFDIKRQRIGFAERYTCSPGLSINGVEVCTEESKTCGDGSTVGRDPKNNCEFKLCADGRTAAGAGQQIATNDNDAQRGHGSNMEFDGQGASNSASGYKPGRSVGNNANSIHSANGAKTDIDEDQPLPLAEGRVYQALFVGPGVNQAKGALIHNKDAVSSHNAESVWWSTFGFFLFFFSFFLTAVFTHDNIGGYYAQIFGKNDKSVKDDTDKAMNAWQRGKSFYNTKQEPEKKQDSFNWKQSNKKGFFGVGDNESMSALGATKSVEDRPYYDQSVKASAGRHYFEKSLSEDSKSSGFFGVLKSDQSSRNTDESAESKNTSERPYYEKGMKDFKAPQDKSQKPVYKKLDPSDSSRMPSKDTSVRHPQKPDFSKFIKPVNSGDRPRISSVSGSSFRTSTSSAYSTESSFYDVPKPEKPHIKQLDDDEYSSAYSYRSSSDASKSSRPHQQEDAQQYRDEHSGDEYSYDSRYDVKKGAQQRYGDEPSTSTYTYDSRYDVQKGSRQRYGDEPSTSTYTYGSRYNVQKGVPKRYGDERSTSTYTYGSRYDDASKPSMQQKQIPRKYGEEYSTGTYTYGSTVGDASKPSEFSYEYALKNRQLPRSYGDERSTSTYTYGASTVTNESSSDEVSKYSTGTYAYGPKPRPKKLDDGSESDAYSYSGESQSYRSRGSQSEGDLYNPTKPSKEIQDEYDYGDTYGDDDTYGDVQSFYGE